MHAEKELASRIPRGLTVTGDLASEHDLVIDGTFDGQVMLPERRLTITRTGQVKGKVIARLVEIAGTLEGTAVGSARVVLGESALVTGHLQTPSIVIAEGARFDGSVDPKGSEAALQVARYRQKQGEQGG